MKETDYIDRIKPLRHDPSEEKDWQEHYQWVVDNPDVFSPDYVEWNRRQLKVTPKYE